MRWPAEKALICIFQMGEGKHEALSIASFPSRNWYEIYTPCLPHAYPEKYYKIMLVLQAIIRRPTLLTGCTKDDDILGRCG